MGCLQSYFRKGSYDVYEAHSTGLSPSPSSAAAAAVTSAKPTTPPGSNGHAPEGVEEDSPPPRPPPKKSHEAKAQAAAAAAAAAEETDPSQPPALPPKRHSKASSGSQSVKVEPQPGVEPGGTTSTKSDGSTVTDGSPAPAKSDSQDSSAMSQPASKEAASPTEAVTSTPPQNDTLVSEATDTPGGTNSSDAVSPLKKDEVMTSPIAGGEENSKGEETKSPGTGEAQDGSQMSTPGPMETLTPTSVVISPPDDEGGSLGERISPLEEPPTTPSTEVQEVSRDTPKSRPQSNANPPEVSITPPEDKPVDEAKDDAPRPSSVVSKEMESTSVVSGSIVTDSAIAEDKESPSEAAVRRSVVGEKEGAVASTEGKETPKGRDSGLSSDEGSTPMAVAQADDPAQGPATETGEARDVHTGDSPAAVQVSEEVNKTESDEARSVSRPASAVVEKTDEKPASVDECGNVVVGDSNEGNERLTGGADDDVDGDKIGKEKSFGFGDSASQDTVVHVKTEGSTEIPNVLSQEKVASPQEQHETSQKSVEDMSVPEEGAKEEVKEAIVAPSPEVKEATEEVKKTPEVSSQPSEPIALETQAEQAPQSPTKETEAPLPTSPVMSPPTSQDEQPLPSPTKDKPPAQAGEENAAAFEKEQTNSPVPHEPESSPSQAETFTASVPPEEPPPASPVKEAPVSPPDESASTEVKEEELPPLSPKKEPEISPPPSVVENASVPPEEQGPASPSKEVKEESVPAVQDVPQMEEKPVVKEDTAPESPKDKSEASSEELPPPPPPEAEKESEQSISEAMPPPPPPEDMVAASTEVPQTEEPKSQERPLSATEEEVASILLGQNSATEDTKKEETVKQEEEQKDLPPPPPAAQDGNTEEDFPPPPPDMTEDVEIQSPADVDGRTRSASFELVEVLNLGGSLEEGEEGAGAGGELREGRGLVKRVPTPVNTDWPPNQEEEDEEEERASISPEATATPSVTPESKQSEEEGAGPKLIKDAASGSLEGISEVASPRAEAKEEKSPAQAATAEEFKEIVKVEAKVNAEEVKISPTIKVEAEEPPVPSAPDEDVIVVEEGKRIPGDIEVPECAVTNQGPPPEVLEEVQENDKEERAKSSEEVRKEVEEVGRIEVEEVIKKAVVEAERRDRESKMSGEVLDEDTIVVEAATNGHNGAPIEEDKGEKNVTSPEGPSATQVSGEANEVADHEAVKSENHTETVEVSNDASKAVDGNSQKVESPEADKPVEKAGNESPEVKNDTVHKLREEKTNGVNGSSEVSEDPAVVTKVKTPVKTKAEGEVNGEAETEGTRRSAAQSGEAGSPADEAIEAARSEEEEAAAIKIQSTFRGYAIRRDAGRIGKGAEGEGSGGAGGGGGAGAAEGGGGEPSETVVDVSTRAQSDVPKSSEADLRESLPDGREEEEDRKVWERLEEERRDQAASCIQKGFREFRESAGGAKRLRREDALQDRTTSSSCEAPGSSSSFQRTSGEFHDHVVLPPIVSADILAGETGGMRQGCGVPADGSEGPQGDSGARGLMDSAAARIQAGYRGYRVRKRLREVQNNGTNDHRGSPNGQTDMSNGKEGEAATKIQAGVRGFLTRRRLKRRREDDCENQGVGGGEPGADGHSEEVEKAVVKIQAGFRGYKGRQKAKARRQQDGKKEVK